MVNKEQMDAKRSAAKTAFPPINSNGQVFGASRYMVPAQGARLLAEAEFEDFAPAICVCTGCFVPEKGRYRSYARIYDNRLEINYVNYPCCCCSQERCVVDSSRNFFFDKQPSRSSMYCGVIPCTCCGPPVIYTKVPRCCCGIIDVRPCFGETISAAPSNCFDCKCYCCCGPPCYQMCGTPLMWSMKNSETFLAKFRGALETYVEERAIQDGQYARFRWSTDRAFDCDLAREIDAIAPSPVKGMSMDRGDAGASAVTGLVGAPAVAVEEVEQKA